MNEEQALVTGEPQILQLRVYNFNEFDIPDRFDGTLYVLEKNKSLDYPIDAAFHIFGWHKDVDPEVMKRHCQKRFGWNTPGMIQEGRAELFWSLLQFKPIMYRMVPEVVADEDLPVKPAPPLDPPEKRTRGNKVLSATDAAQARNV
jgi:hypothetical protein